MDAKKPWTSKTLWLNVLAIAGILLQSYPEIGYVLDADTQLELLGAANIILRFFTKQAVTIA